MLFDPDAGKTIEQVLESAWNRSTPEVQVRVRALAHESRRSIGEVMARAILTFQERLEDPVFRRAYLAHVDFQEQPFGPDPLLRKDGIR